MVAYDYDAQKWVSGPEAKRLLAEQKAESLELEKDPAYLAFVRKNNTVLVCPFCGDELAGEASACCGEVGRGQWECADCHEAGDGSRCDQCIADDGEG